MRIVKPAARKLFSYDLSIVVIKNRPYGSRFR
jgi:hypothetical protein